MNQRKINGNWITEYLKFTKEQESPGMFIYGWQYQ